LDVEFIRASGKSQALMTLHTDDVRGVRDEDLVSVRSVALVLGAKLRIGDDCNAIRIIAQSQR
jgi:hypothetical protein